MSSIQCDVHVSGRSIDTSKLPFGTYRKTALAEAFRMAEPFSVTTLEGVMEGAAGDYLMRGPAGELYPCAADIFHKTYEPAGAGHDAAQ